MRNLPALVARACSCAEDTRDDPARVCAACLVLARVRDLLETVSLCMAAINDSDTSDALYALRDAFEKLARSG